MQLTGNEIERFAAWSGDHNPVHVDRQAAQAAGFAEPVAHGVLGVIRALGTVSPRSSAPLVTLEIEFRGPLVRDAQNGVTVVQSGDAVSVTLEQGGRDVLVLNGAKSAARLQPRELAWVAALAESPAATDALKRLDPADHSWETLQSGTELIGTYATDPPPEAATASGLITPLQARVLGLCSYLEGMELPGLRSSITRLRLQWDRPEADSNVVWYRARTLAFDRASRVLQTAVEVATPDGELLATAEFSCYVRFSPVATDIGALSRKLSLGENLLAGKVALVCGGSRGLGADLTCALALAGCRVYAGFRTATEAAHELRRRLAESDLAVEFLQGDAADPTWCESVRSTICDRHGRLDLVVLNACARPAVIPTSPASAKPLGDYVEENLRLGYVPLATFLPLLDESRGALVCLSSSIVADPEPGYAHYAALKQALEAVVQTAVRESSGVYAIVVRPPRLLTSWNDTPDSARAALPADVVAAEIVNHLASPWRAGHVAILDNFPPANHDLPPAADQCSTWPPSELIGLEAPIDEAANEDACELTAGDEVSPEKEICESLIALEAEIVRTVKRPACEEGARDAEIGWLALPSLLDRVHAGAVPIRLKIGSEAQMTGWVIETGGLGSLSVTLGDSELTVRSRHDLPFSLSIIEAGPARDLLLQLGWREIAPFETAELVIHPDLVLKGLSGAAAIAAGWGLRASTAVRAMMQQPARFDIQQVERFDIRHNRLWEATARDIACGIVRDAAWLNANYVDQSVPDIVRLEVIEEGSVRGVVVLTFREADEACPYRRGYLVELIAPPSDARLLKQLVQIAGTAAAECHADALLCLSLGAGLSRALRQNGFRVREPRRFLLVNPAELPETLRRSVLTPADWFMTEDEADANRAAEPDSQLEPACLVGD
jgi:NAD(P)-dependent dehydrogenase (short-subunit alcohol dehydrogenase family)